jgi:hypothetical protein
MTQQPGDRPPPTQLERPPSDRYAPAAPDAEGAGAATPDGSVARAVALSLPGALIAAIVYIVLAGPFSFTAGLVVVGIFAGRIIGLSARFGGGVRVPSDTRVVVALLVTLAWFVVTQVGAWLFAQNEGGTLPLVDYLLEVYGPVVPLTLIAAVLAAWWSAR